MPHGIKIATFRDGGEVEEVFTSTTVRTRDTVFPLFGDAGTMSASEVELQEFGESVRARPDEAELSVAQLSNPQKRKGTSENKRSNGEPRRRRRSRSTSHDDGRRGAASAEPRGRITVKRPARSAERREERQSGVDENSASRSRSCATASLVAMTGKTVISAGDVVFDGGGFCGECVTELHEQCVQDDVRLASYAAELARTVGGAGEGEACEAYDVVAGRSLDHRDEAVAHVMKILDTSEAILTAYGRRESLKEYFILRQRERAVLPLVEIDSIEGHSLLEVDRKRRRRSTQSTTGCDGKRVVRQAQVCSTRRCAARPVVSGRVNGRGAHRTRESGGVRTGDREHRFDRSLSSGLAWLWHDGDDAGAITMKRAKPGIMLCPRSEVDETCV